MSSDLVLASRSALRRSGPRSRWRAVALVLAVVGLGVTARVWHHWHNKPPYPASAVVASVHVEVIDPARAQARVDQLAGVGRLNALAVPDPPTTAQELVGQLRVTAPHQNSSGQYGFFIIDNRTHETVPALYAVGPPGSNVAAGWDGTYDKIAKKYPWLRMLAMVPDGNGGFAAPGMAIDVPPGITGAVTFVALDPGALPITDPATQLTVALVFMNGHGPIYWAKNLTATS